MAGGASFVERRRFLRLNSDCPVQLKQMPQNYPVQIHNSISEDISEGGLQLSSFYFYPVHCKLLVELFVSQEAEPIKVVGRVVWVEQMPYQERYKVGIEFSDLNEESRVYLRQVISDSALS
ncbi:MAG: PilZ domain-containing protein [Candidatus Omnitrophica bacterium]|nr:PilZ domain-containing protein [Candidatus Omnitrophota bacterium]MBU4479071.1 PilZ domain-containing protein [Candidatus Omnitrophota bacterium]MCG2704162.1 PilZ domain-containing protein [Candidatus Omnitrophota bacterium]